MGEILALALRTSHSRPFITVPHFSQGNLGRLLAAWTPSKGTSSPTPCTVLNPILSRASSPETLFRTPDSSTDLQGCSSLVFARTMGSGPSPYPRKWPAGMTPNTWLLITSVNSQLFLLHTLFTKLWNQSVCFHPCISSLKYFTWYKLKHMTKMFEVSSFPPSFIKFYIQGKTAISASQTPEWEIKNAALEISRPGHCYLLNPQWELEGKVTLLWATWRRYCCSVHSGVKTAWARLSEGSGFKSQPCF